MKTLEIQKFLILNSIIVEYTDLLVIIGPQAQGKSLISKLLYFFEGLEKDVFSNVVSNESKLQLQSKLRDKFLQIFNTDNLQSKEIYISFTCEKYICTISKISSNSKISIDFDDTFWENLKMLKSTYKKCKKIKDQFDFPSFYELFGEDIHSRIDFDNIVDSFSKYLVSRQKKDKKESYDLETIKQKLSKSIEFDKLYMGQSKSIYVPAGRSFFANLQKSIFNFLTNNLPIDFFLKEFGARYERMKYGCIENQEEFFYSKEGKLNFENTCLTILGGNYIRLKDRDYIKSKDGLVNLEFASSGQQEALPMLLSIVSTSKNTTLVIEEPEAHLFPSAQAEVVKLIGKTYNLTNELSNFIITTHSPYILMSINNSIQAYIAKHEKINIKSTSGKEWIDASINSNNISAYILSNGKIKSIIDDTTGLINAHEIDQISSKLSSDFEELLGELA